MASLLASAGTSAAQNNTNYLDGLELYEIQRKDIFVTSEALEKGCWRDSKVAKFRETKVAAMYPCEVGNRSGQFMKEVKTATRIHHPNLVLFIGASITEEAIVLMELMHTSLKQHFEFNDGMCDQDLLSIALDITQALNYLHLMQPDPIIHRKINPTSIFLEPIPQNRWKAKVSDYCFADFRQPCSVEMDAFIAPEVILMSLISPKIDIFSFGIVLIQLCTGKMPKISTCDQLITTIHYQYWVQLIQCCIQKHQDRRPSATDVIKVLNDRLQLLQKKVGISPQGFIWGRGGRRVT